MGVAEQDDERRVLSNGATLEEEEEDDASLGSGHDSDSDADDFHEYDDELADQKKLKKKFDEILRSIENGALDLQGSSKAQEFVEQHDAILRRKTAPKDQNFLHLVAEYDKEDLPVKKIKDLVQALIRLPDVDLLRQRDVDGKTPLFCAISMRNHRLVKAMCEAHGNIDSVLKIPKGQKNYGSNCLHQAILNKSSSKDDEIVKILIDKSGPETLCAVDENGLTPLHLAVEYRRCDEAQPEIVRAMVERCDGALDKTVKHKDKGLLSPYRWHEHTYQEAVAKAAAEARKGAEKLDADGVEKAADPDSYRASKSRMPDGPKPQGTLPDIPLPHTLRRMTTLEGPTGKFGLAVRKATGDGFRVKSKAGTPEIDGRGSRAGTRTPTMKKKLSAKKTRSSKVQPKEASALEIKTFLKLYYLRKSRHDEAVEFLYGVQQDRQIYFDLFGCDSELSERRITESWHHLVFEDILQYVAIPQVHIEANPPVGADAGKRPPKPDGAGRTDLRILFKWLKEQRGVKTMLKVIVDDLKEPAHSDEAIESCLTGMGVETWDWRKKDLCSEVIHRVSPDAKVVHLYWSGNNAVLRGWSDSDGLKKLASLETLHLYVQQGLERRARTRENVAAFKKRIETDSKIKVVERKLKTGGQDNGSGQNEAVRDPYERHKWIATMEEFADFLQNAVRHADPKLFLEQDVTVAIIDDGVDINDPTIQAKIDGGRSFCQRDEEENLNQPYYVSAGGHGTAMAGLICKVCPNVRLYILKLNEHFPEGGRRQITARSAAKAVRAAVDRKVDIISMSWTIEKTETNKADVEDLERAIEAAAAQNILMFCAATDQGAFKDRSYPAASGTKRIFKIGAAEASGAALKWLGDQTLVDYIMPGHQVVMERPGDPHVRQYTALTGSSVATALASGLAAVVLYCVQVGCVVRARARQRQQQQLQQQPPEQKQQQELQVDLSEYHRLRSHGRMDLAFRQIGTTKESEHKYITVWNRFTKPVKRAEGELRDMYVDLVADLADELMREE